MSIFALGRRRQRAYRRQFFAAEKRISLLKDVARKAQAYLDAVSEHDCYAMGESEKELETGSDLQKALLRIDT